METISEKKLQREDIALLTKSLSDVTESSEMALGLDTKFLTLWS